jgi:hypothetical protein
MFFIDFEDFPNNPIVIGSSILVGGLEDYGEPLWHLGSLGPPHRSNGD